MVCDSFFISFTVSLLNLWCKQNKRKWQAFMLLSSSFHAQVPRFKLFKWSHGFQSMEFQNEASTFQKGKTLLLLPPSLFPMPLLTMLLSSWVYSHNIFTLSPSRDKCQTYSRQRELGLIKGSRSTMMSEDYSWFLEVLV